MDTRFRRSRGGARFALVATRTRTQYSYYGIRAPKDSNNYEYCRVNSDRALLVFVFDFVSVSVSVSVSDSHGPVLVLVQ